VDEPFENIHASVTERKIAKVMKAGNHEDVVLEEEDREYERGDVFLSFYHQASISLSRQVPLVGHLSA